MRFWLCLGAMLTMTLAAGTLAAQETPAPANVWRASTSCPRGTTACRF